jgi:hypothetical protein
VETGGLGISADGRPSKRKEEKQEFVHVHVTIRSGTGDEADTR